MRTTLHRIAALVLVAASAATSACNKDSPTENDKPGDPNDPVAGSFALSTVDTKGLPVKVLSDTDYSIEVTAGSAVFDSTNHTFIMPMTTRETVAGFASTYVDTTRGTWSQSASVVMLTATGALPITAQWDGRKLKVSWTIGASTNTYSYVRR